MRYTTRPAPGRVGSRRARGRVASECGTNYNPFVSNIDIEAQLLERFIRYVQIDTVSDRHSNQVPSTGGQWELLKLLKAELKEIGLLHVELDANGFLIARVESNSDDVDSRETIGFMAHVDTVPDVPGAAVRPVVHNDYNGEPIRLDGGIVIDPPHDSHIERYRGETIITSDGSTLLGADDKAGVAEMMTLASCLIESDAPHGEIELIFTPDEETGRGMDFFPITSIRSVACYTLDGSEEGVIEAECFNAAKVEVVCTGVSMHTGTARGKLINAISMINSLLSLIPQAESPEATDGRYGFFAPMELSGSIEASTCSILVRSFDEADLNRRIAARHAFARSVEAAFPGGDVAVEVVRQYSNMRSFIDADERVVARLEQAVRLTGIEPERRVIRGGTDGSRLSEMGIPTPNLFTGGHNYHSRTEWAVLSVMARTVEAALNLCRLWA